MSKRKLNRRQQWRIAKIQAEKEKRLKQNEETIDSLDLRADEKHLRGLVVARFGKQVEIEALNTPETHTQTYLCHIRANIPDLVVGDEVVWQIVDGDSGVILSLCERQSLIYRRDKNGLEKNIAANIHQVFVVIAPEPEPQSVIIDRYLVACQLFNLDIHILVNKSDLLEKDIDKKANIERIHEIYHDLVDEFSYCSIHREDELNNLLRQFADKNNVLIGQSGVGKSSLVKAITQEKNIETKSLSKKSGLGVHTTSTSRLYHLINSGKVIDSPGIRDFDLDEVTMEELQSGFLEFNEYREACKFRNCKHHKEPKCEIKAAVERRDINPERYNNYLQIADSLNLLM